MTGFEQFGVCLLGVLCAAIIGCSVVKSWATSRVEVAQHAAQAAIETARAHADAHVRAHQVVAEAQYGPAFVPPAWPAEEGL